MTFKPSVPVMSVSMAQFKNNEFWFVNESCTESDCLNGDFHICSKKHQILKRDSFELCDESQKQSNHKNEEPEPQMNFLPKHEFDSDFNFEDNIDNIEELNEVIEISDFEEDSDEADSMNDSYISKIISFRRFIRTYGISSYFSTNSTITEIEASNVDFDDLDRKLNQILTNGRSFGERGFYPEDFECLEGSNWLNDKIVDSMLEVIQNKCLSTGNAVLAIRCIWFTIYTVIHI